MEGRRGMRRATMPARLLPRRRLSDGSEISFEPTSEPVPVRCLSAHGTAGTAATPTGTPHESVSEA